MQSKNVNAASMKAIKKAAFRKSASHELHLPFEQMQCVLQIEHRQHTLQPYGSGQLTEHENVKITAWSPFPHQTVVETNQIPPPPSHNT